MKPAWQNRREHVEALVAAALAAADPYRSVTGHLRLEGNKLWAGPHDLTIDGGSRVFIVAVGKAAVPMAQAAAEILQSKISGGLAVTKKGQTGRVDHPRIDTLYAGHPLADESSVAAAGAVLDLLHEADRPRDLILFLISGGASALISRPLLPLDEWQTLNEALLGSGCTIQELNTVRKQLDRVKGGGLLAAAAPARCLNLILSDVIGNPIDKIGSGPTVPNDETPAGALAVLDRVGVAAPAAREALASQTKDSQNPAALTPPPTLIVGDVRQAGEAARSRAAGFGFQAGLLTWHLTGEAREAGGFAAALARSAPAATCWILGGETTVTLKGNGIGGRNLEVALGAALALAHETGALVATLATDGDDGPTGAAGAVITGETIPLALASGLSPYAALQNNDSYTFFQDFASQTGQTPLLITGQTGTNVNDLIFVLKYS